MGAFERERVREGLGIPVAPGRAATGGGLESVVVVEDAVGLDEFFEEGEKEQRAPDTVPGERDTRRGRVEPRRGRQRAGITADEDIEDEEGKKWY